MVKAYLGSVTLLQMHSNPFIELQLFESFCAVLCNQIHDYNSGTPNSHANSDDIRRAYEYMLFLCCNPVNPCCV